MLRQSLIYLVLSIFVVIFAKYVHILVVYLDMVYTYLNLTLAPIFSYSETGIMVRKVLVLVLLPILIVAIPAIIYWFIKSRRMPYFIEITWVVWLVLVLSKVLIS